MYNHIAINTIDNEFDFFNVQEFGFDEEAQVYRLLSQNNEWHEFPKANVKEVIV